VKPDERIVVLPDLQIPFHIPKQVNAVIDFIESYKPEQVWIVGDWLDSPGPSRWSKGSADEYSYDLQKEIDLGVEILARVRKAARSAPIHFKTGNHDIRVENYVAKYGPALSSLRVLRLENMLEMERLHVTCHRSPVELAPGWVLAHGDEGSLSRAPGGTALALAKRFQRSVICGHTHRLGAQHEAYGLNGKQHHIVQGVEVGCMMDMRQAHYLPGGHGNWQHGFGILYRTGKRVTHSLIPMTLDGKFVAEGIVR